MTANTHLIIAFCIIFSTFQQSAPSTTTAKLPDGCVLMDPTNVYCMSCNQVQLYYLAKANCIRCGVKSCARIDANGQCVECLQGYFLRQGQVCVVVTMIPNCLKYSTTSPTTVCLSCNDSTMLVNGVCLPKIPNCDGYIPGTNLCANCADGYTQSPDWASCIPGGISYCLRYDCLGLCVLCSDDLPRLSINRNLCLVTIDYCLTYQADQNLCKACFRGYHLTSNKRGCVPNIQFCITHFDNTDRISPVTCIKCATNYQLSPDATACWSVIPNCRTFVTLNRTCSQCNPGYILTDDSKACLLIIENCLTYQSSTGLTLKHKCIICRDLFIPSSDYYLCIPHCPVDTKYCTTLNKCITTPCCCLTDDGCGNCLTLQPYYAICPTNGRCSPIPPQCVNNHDSCGNCICQTPLIICPITNECKSTICPNPNQTYNVATCQCECPNKCDSYHKHDDKCECQCLKPPICGDEQLLNTKDCTCYCPVIKTCGCGEFFDYGCCGCKPSPNAFCASPIHNWVSNPVCDCVCKVQPTCLCNTSPVNSTCGCSAYPTCQNPKIWDVPTCQCKCASVQQCSCGFVWSDVTCQCIVDSRATCASSVHVWKNSPICDCVCKVQPTCLCSTQFVNSTCGCTAYPNCPSPKVYNVPTCQCICPSVQQCGCGFVWSDATCQCVTDVNAVCVSNLHVWSNQACNCICQTQPNCLCSTQFVNSTCGCTSYPNCPSPKVYNVPTCQCVCPSVQQCGCGFVWNDATCQCITDVKATCVSNLHSWNNQFCDCICKTQPTCLCNTQFVNSTCGCTAYSTCPTPKIFDVPTCQCKCPLIQQCSCGFTWNDATCQCVVDSRATCISTLHSWSNQACDCVCKTQPNCLCNTQFVNSTCGCTPYSSCSTPKVFNVPTCKCICPSVQQCGCGFVWNDATCQCIVDQNAYCLSNLHVWSNQVCNCVCRNQPNCLCNTQFVNSTCGCSAYSTCPTPKVYNVPTCQCVCPSIQQCGCGFVWNDATCQCIVDVKATCVSTIHSWSNQFCDCVCKTQPNCLCNTQFVNSTCGCTAYPNCQSPKVYNVPTCQCICPSVQQCGCGFIWNDATCQCIIDVRATCISTLHAWSNQACDCVCRFQPTCQCQTQFVNSTCGCTAYPICQSPKVYNVPTCQCICPSVQTCPCGFVWNDASCQCIVDQNAYCLSNLHIWSNQVCNCVCRNQPNCLCNTQFVNSTCGCTAYPTCQSPKVYNVPTCQCICPSVQHCGCGFVWNESICQCVVDSRATCVSNLHSWSNQVCDCVCKTQPNCLCNTQFVNSTCGCSQYPLCQSPKQFDVPTCQCKCSFIQQCGCGFIWSETTCQCVVDSRAYCLSNLHIWSNSVCDCVCRIQPSCLCGTQPNNSTCQCSAYQACPSPKIYDTQICQCRCPAVQICGCGFVWSDNSCSCIVDSRATCLSTIHQWSNSVCDCVCRTQPNCICNTQFVNSTCGCTAYPTCQFPKIYNTASCQCICPSVQQCGCGYQWNDATCSCVDITFSLCPSFKFYNTQTCQCQCINPPTCGCYLTLNLDTCTCPPRVPPCPGMTFNCATSTWDQPLRPIDVYSCFIFVQNGCQWEEPACPDGGSLIKWGLGTNAPKCQCGNLIEHCIEYYTNTDANSVAVYPLLCRTCKFGYRRNSGQFLCKIKNTFTVSFFFGQFGFAVGSFRGHLIYDLNAFGANKYGFILRSQNINFTADYDSHFFSFEWSIASYLISGVVSYTCGIAVFSSTSIFKPVLYLTQVFGTFTFDITEGFKSISGTNSSTPIPSLLWTIPISTSFWTESYYFGSIMTTNQSSYFDSSFSMVAVNNNDTPCRFYSEGIYQS